MAINDYGDILPCNMMQGRTSVKEREGRTLVGFWNETCEPVRKRLKDRDYPEACTSCVCFLDTNLLASLIKHPLRNLPVGLRWAVNRQP